MSDVPTFFYLFNDSNMKVRNRKDGIDIDLNGQDLAIFFGEIKKGLTMLRTKVKKLICKLCRE